MRTVLRHLQIWLMCQDKRLCLFKRRKRLCR
nr:MAG TPA: hypothetical protein [Caudoviricetes sp.]